MLPSGHKHAPELHQTHVHLVITHKHTHIPVLFISPKELIGQQEAVSIGLKAVLRPLEVADDVISAGGAKLAL